MNKLDVKPDIKDTDAEKAYKKLCTKELDWVKKNHDAIFNAIIGATARLFFVLHTKKNR